MGITEMSTAAVDGLYEGTTKDQPLMVFPRVLAAPALADVVVKSRPVCGGIDWLMSAVSSFLRCSGDSEYPETFGASGYGMDEPTYSRLRERFPSMDDMQHFQLLPYRDGGAELQVAGGVDDGVDESETFYAIQRFFYACFPWDEEQGRPFRVWAGRVYGEPGIDWVLMLPSEY